MKTTTVVLIIIGVIWYLYENLKIEIGFKDQTMNQIVGTFVGTPITIKIKDAVSQTSTNTQSPIYITPTF